jgi:hypothetical protein
MGEEQVRLRPEDERLLDELLESGFDPGVLERMEPEARERGERLIHMLGLLHDYPVEDGDDTLVHATLARIDRFERDRVDRMRIEEDGDAGSSARRHRFRLPDLVSAAAILLIAIGLLWPAIDYYRQPTVDHQVRADGMTGESGDHSARRSTPPDPAAWSTDSPMLHADFGFGRFSQLFVPDQSQTPMPEQPWARSFRVYEVTGLEPFRRDREMLLRMDLEHIADVRDLLDLSLSLQPVDLERFVVLTDGQGTVFLIDRQEFNAYWRLWTRYGMDVSTQPDDRPDAAAPETPAGR